MELNRVFLLGNLTRDPESRFLQSGSQVCKMGLAVNRRWGGREGGDKKEEVLFIDVEAWNKTAELCAQYLQRGSQVLVEGRLKMDQYQTQSGENRTKFVVVAERVQFGARPEGGGRPAGEGGGPGARRQSAPPPAAAEPREDYDRSPSYDGGGETEDDLPF
ncbi:MAG: single-stranded DNA-binding protein [Candidatus Sumerlaeia bacterium]|nr:single-stranded DNA-binding protein [Candidatus Sumerlaeia bacterium]